jgi:hypothetical protein
MRNVFRVLFCLAMFLTATAALAQVVDGGGGEVQDMNGISDGCGDTMNADQCFWSPSSGGNYGYCDAYGRKGQLCQASNKDLFSGGTYCDSVSRSANCYCDPVTKKASGTCTYYK